MIPERFRPYLGDNHTLFPASYAHSGAFCFSRWIGYFLCKDLWDALATQLHIKNLYIYRKVEGFLYHGLPPNSVVIILDEDDKVMEIIYETWYS